MKLNVITSYDLIEIEIGDEGRGWGSLHQIIRFENWQKSYLAFKSVKSVV